MTGPQGIVRPSRNGEELIYSDFLIEELERVLRRMKSELPTDDEVSIATAFYDEESDRLSVCEVLKSDSVVSYSRDLSKIPTLVFVKSTVGPQLIKNCSLFDRPSIGRMDSVESDRNLWSLTHVSRESGRLVGIVFINFQNPEWSAPETVAVLTRYVHLIELIVRLVIAQQGSVLAALVAAQEIGAYRDTDTANHLRRMAHFARLISESVASLYSLSGAFSEQIFRFAPMHDIGKVGISDAILLKPGKLTDEEFTIIRTHSKIGAEIIDKLVAKLHLEKMPGRSILRNLVLFHHERQDGSGYPYGLRAGDIPIESQIVAVADVFDALASRRPYKEPWSVDRCFEELRRQSHRLLNANCVDALVASRSQVENILRDFSD